VLWRHGQTAWNLEDRFQGSTDVELDDVGQAQAERAARLLASLEPNVIVSSDLRRAQDTAEALARLVGLPVRLDPRLRETFGGSWQGRTAAELAERDREAYAAWRSGVDVPAGGGERRTEVAARVCPAIMDAVADVPPGGTLVVVTHGGSARAAIGTLLDLPLDRWAVVGGLANCSWSVLEASEHGTGGWRLVEHNAGSLPEPVMGDEE
jgi:glucosyl-3-phosphoglycerate phosphatase